MCYVIFWEPRIMVNAEHVGKQKVHTQAKLDRLYEFNNIEQLMRAKHGDPESSGMTHECDI